MANSPAEHALNLAKEFRAKAQPLGYLHPAFIVATHAVNLARDLLTQERIITDRVTNENSENYS